MKEKEKRPPRDIRINVYLTDSELNKLHDISDEQETTISELCRECALTEDLSFITTVKIDDTIKPIDPINNINSLTQRFTKCLRQSPLYSTEKKDIETQLNEINSEHLKLRRIVLKKRKKIQIETVKILNEKLKEDIGVYKIPATKKMHSISISVTVEEYKSIKEIAKTIGCSMSIYLKRCVLIRYGKGRIEIRTDALDELIQRLNRQTRFYEAIVDDVEKRYPGDGDIEAVKDILNQCITLIADRKKSIDTSARDVKFESEIYVKEFLAR